MELSYIRLQPLANCAFYGIGLRATLRFVRGREVPVAVDGWIATAEGKHIGAVHAVPQNTTNKFPLSAADSFQRETNQLDQTIEFAVPLSRETIDYVEQQRNQEKKRDVKLKVVLQVMVCNSKSIASHLFIDEKMKVQNTTPAARGGHLADANFVLYKWDRDIGGRVADMNLISGDASRDFLEFEVTTFKSDLAVAASDWVHDYVPALGIGRSLNMELPMPEELELPKEVKEQFRVAVDDLGKMHDSYNRGDWIDLIENSRGIYELLKDEKLIRKLLDSDGYPTEAVDDVCKCVRALWDFTSKFHHHLDKDKKMIPKLRPSKEEAELIYALSLTIVNLLSRKAKRQA
jgi:hypothetical protein